ncbi:MAG TPA: metal-dependent transcriptional regulator [Firmicutes bacterium]|nr:metal-dependent transcriptional regulator [Bacillota bacterium]
MSSSMQDYLEAILNLSEENPSVRVTDIAERLHVAKASVNEVLGNLKEMGLVFQERYGPVSLTPAGREYAIEVRRRHGLLLRFLTDVLGVDRVTAEKDACRMEHAVSPQTIERLVGFLEKFNQ